MSRNLSANICSVAMTQEIYIYIYVLYIALYQMNVSLFSERISVNTIIFILLIRLLTAKTHNLLLSRTSVLTLPPDISRIAQPVPV